MRMLVALLAAFALAGPAFAYDGEPNRYTVTIDDAVRTAKIEADVWMPSNVLAMFGVLPIEALPNGQADLIRDLVVTGAGGKPLTVKNLGEGD